MRKIAALVYWDGIILFRSAKKLLLVFLVFGIAIIALSALSPKTAPVIKESRSGGSNYLAFANAPGSPCPASAVDLFQENFPAYIAELKVAEFYLSCDGNKLSVLFKNNLSIPLLVSSGIITMPVIEGYEIYLDSYEKEAAYSISAAAYFYFPLMSMFLFCAYNALRRTVYDDLISLRAEEYIGSSYTLSQYCLAKSLTSIIYTLFLASLFIGLLLLITAFFIQTAYYSSFPVREALAPFLGQNPSVATVCLHLLQEYIYPNIILFMLPATCITFVFSVYITRTFLTGNFTSLNQFYPFIIALVVSIPVVSLKLVSPVLIMYLPYFNLYALVQSLVSETDASVALVISSNLLLALGVGMYSFRTFRTGGVSTHVT